MSWNKDFQKGWIELAKSQRIDRARYVVEQGVKEGHSIREIVRAAGTEYPLSHTNVQSYIDLYAFMVGGGLQQAPSYQQLQQARRDYNPHVTDDEASEYAEEIGASDGVARRLLEGKKIAEVMKEEGLVTDEGLDIEVDKPTKTRIVKATADHDRWMRAFEAYWGEMNDFLAFLRNTKQDNMKDSTVTNKLRRMAAQLEAQADRFGIGYDKASARQKARKGA